MKDISTVMKFTIKDMIKRKSFIVSTLIILLMIVVGLNIPNIINLFDDGNKENKLLIVDSNNIFEGNLKLLKETDLGYEIDIQNYSFEEIKEKLADNSYSEALLVEKDNLGVKVRYLVENVNYVSKVPDVFVNSLNTLYTNMQIRKLGLSEEQIKEIMPNFEFTMEQTGDSEVNGNIFVMMMMSLVLFYAIYFCAFQVSSSITTEKTSKIMETLVTSTSPRTIVLGKTIGIGLVGLIQMVLIVSVAYVTARLSFDPELLNSLFDMSNITIGLGLITLLYFILGYFTYSLLYALTGSTVSKPEDIQSANGPVSILVVVGFYLSYFTMMNPTSDLNSFAAIFPFSSPFCMPFRIMMGLATVSDIIISVVVLIITILVIAKIAIQIYSNAILNYGTKMSLKDIINLYKTK